MATLIMGDKVWDVTREYFWTQSGATQYSHGTYMAANENIRNYLNKGGYWRVQLNGGVIQPIFHENRSVFYFTALLKADSGGDYYGESSYAGFSNKIRTTGAYSDFKYVVYTPDPSPTSAITTAPSVGTNGAYIAQDWLNDIRVGESKYRTSIISVRHQDSGDPITVDTEWFWCGNWNAGYDNWNNQWSPKSNKLGGAIVIPAMPALSVTDDSGYEADYNGEVHNHQIRVHVSNLSDERASGYYYSICDGYPDVNVWIGTDSEGYSGDNGVQNVHPDSEGYITILTSEGQVHACDLTYYYKLTDDRAYLGEINKEEITGSFTFKINKADLTTNEFNAPTAKNTDYSGSAITLANAGSFKSWGANKDEDNVGCKFQYRYKLSTSSTWSSWSNTIPSAVNIGTYDVEYRIVGNKDINDYAGGSFQSKILATSTTVYVHVPNVAGLRVASNTGNAQITWPGGTYDNNSTWTKVFEANDTLDFPTIQTFVNSSIYTMSTANTANDPSGYLMVGYSTSSTPTNLDYHEGKTYTLTGGADIHLYPRLKWFNQSTYVGEFDNQNHNAKLTPMTASGANRIAASGVTIKADTAAKDEPNAPIGTTVKSSSTTAGTAVTITNNYKNAGTYRIGITLTETADGETFTKTGHTTNNYIRITKAPRNIQLNPASISMETNEVKTAIVTGWDDLDSSAATASVLSASARATVTPATISKGGTVTITSGLSPGIVNINITISETDNYLAETTPIIVNIAGQGNGIYWYNGTQWILTKPFVWNGSAWSEDFI